jgi:zinc protease
LIRRPLASAFPLLLAGAALLAAGSVPAPRPAAASPDPARAEPALVTLRNGLRLLIAPDPAATAVDVAAWVAAGVRHERAGRIGVSHVVEHLPAGPGLTDADDRRRIEAEGGTSVAYTSADFTCYTHTLPRAALEAAFRLEAARLRMAPTAAAFQAARAVVRDENRLRRAGNAVEFGVEKLYATAYQRHPYRWPVLGDDADLERLTPEACREFLAARYTPDHVLITVTGDVDPAEALALARRHLEPIRARGDRRDPAPEPEPAAPRRGREAGPFPVPLLVVGWRVPGSEVDAAGLDLLTAVLAKGPSARLPGAIGRDRSVFTDAGRDSRRDGTMLWAIAALAPGADTAAVERDLIATAEALARDTIAAGELDRARRRLEIGTLLGRQTVRERGQALGTAQIVSGDWRAADAWRARLGAVTPAELRQLAARSFTAARRTVTWIVPAGGGAP